MNQLRMFLNSEIYWENTAIFASKYQLVAGNEVLATLDVASWGRDATAEAAEGVVSIQSEGFFSTTYHIYAGNTELAVFTPDWGGSTGELRFTDGRTLIWDREGFFSGIYAWKDMSNNELMSFQSSFGGGKLYVTISPMAADILELSLLAILGRYLENIQQRRNTAVVASTI
jgi:hypothetical protein